MIPLFFCKRFRNLSTIGQIDTQDNQDSCQNLKMGESLPKKDNTWENRNQGWNSDKGRRSGDPYFLDGIVGQEKGQDRTTNSLVEDGQEKIGILKRKGQETG